MDGMSFVLEYSLGLRFWFLKLEDLLMIKHELEIPICVNIVAAGLAADRTG